MRSRSGKTKARSFRKAMSPPEARLWKYLKGDGVPFTVKRQVPLEAFFLDLYIGAVKLCLEVDGLWHDQRIEKDHERDAVLLTHGIETFRIKAVDILLDVDAVVDMICVEVDKRSAP